MTTAQIGESGIVLGGTDAEGVRWRLDGDLWGPSPQPRSISGQRVNAHGSWNATRFYESRSWSLEGLVTAPTHEALHQARVRLESAIGLQPFKVCGFEPAFERCTYYRRDSPLAWSELSRIGDGVSHARYSVTVVAPDPRLYAMTGKSVSMGFPSTTGGLTWPATWPATWSATVINGEAQLLNEGNETAWPTWRIDGPVVQPMIVNQATGESMNFDLELGPGEWLIVDTANHRVLANGDVQASRRDKFWGTWWGLAPGVTPVIARFAGASASTGALLTGDWFDTWI